MRNWEDEDAKPRYVPSEAVWMLFVVMAALWSGGGGYLLGMDNKARLALDAYAREGYAAHLFDECMASGNDLLRSAGLTMNQIQLTDAYLHQRIMELPAIVVDR